MTSHERPASADDARLQSLYERGPAAGQPSLTEPLRALYGGDLAFPATDGRPHVFANFVQTLDGAVSFSIPGRAGGGEISGFNGADQFLMGLLRSLADAVVFGAGTLHGDSGHVRTAAFIAPAASGLFAELRSRRAGPREPLNVIVTGSGQLDLAEPTFHTPGLQTLVVTTAAGERRLRSDHGARMGATAVRAIAESGPVDPPSVLAVLYRDFNVRLVLHEGGPRLFGAFMAAGMVDELFLTIAPQVAGRRSDKPRPSLAKGIAFAPETAPWFQLESVKRSVDHLFLRLSRRRS